MVAKVTRHFDRHDNPYYSYWNGRDYFEIYPDSQIEVREILRPCGREKITWVAIVVDGAATLIHQRKFEAGRPHLRKNAEKLVSELQEVQACS